MECIGATCHPTSACSTFNLDQGWKRIDAPFVELWGSKLLNANDILYFIEGGELGESGGSVFQYSPRSDVWSQIAPNPHPNFPCRLNADCVSYIGNDEIFAQFYCEHHDRRTINLKFSLNEFSWFELPPNIHESNYLGKCLTVQIVEDRFGVILIGGRTLNRTSEQEITEHNTVEILDVATEVWTEMTAFDDGWITSKVGQYESSSSGLLHLDDKPSIIGWFNGTKVNFKEQFDVVKNVWTMEKFDMEDSDTLSNVVNIPRTIFPPCN